MKVYVKDFTNESTDMIYPMLLQYNDIDKGNDIVLATSSNGDYVNGIVVTNNNQLDGFSQFSFQERYFLKKKLVPFLGEIVIRN